MNYTFSEELMQFSATRQRRGSARYNETRTPRAS